MLHRTRQSLVRKPTNVEQCTARAPAELGIASAKGRNGTAELLRIIDCRGRDYKERKLSLAA